MSKNIFLFMLLIILFSVNVAYGDECLRYEPEKIKIAGVIIRKTFPGPPEYESIEKGDAPETFWILNLLKPICVAGEENDLVNVTEKEVRSIQLVFMKPTGQYKKYKHLVSKKVVATGILYHSHTIHHRTKVLMEVFSIDK